MSSNDAVKREAVGKKHIVGIADMKISTCPDDEIITYSLGSCLGISAYDPQAQVGGLLHVMLPVSHGPLHAHRQEKNPLMYVDSGVPKFLNAILRKGALKDNLVIKVAGGAFMNVDSNVDPFFKIGKRNFIVLRKLLWKNGLLMKRFDVGGNHPRTMTLNMGDGTVFLKTGAAMKKL